jgi:hypothetical protein
VAIEELAVFGIAQSDKDMSKPTMLTRSTGISAALLLLAACGSPAADVNAPTAKKSSLTESHRGHLEPAVIQHVVRAHFSAMRRCYEDALAQNASLSGKVTTRFIIAVDGTVSSAADAHDATNATDLGPRFPDPVVTACVVSKFTELKFPRPEGNGSVSVVYPIVFSVGSEEFPEPGKAKP